MSKILVVDDEAIISMQLEERLHAMGYTVAGMAASGEDAIEKARRLAPDLVLMDIVMPGKLNGIDAAKVIAGEMDIPVVFVTSYADDTIIEKAKQVGPYGYIVKPFNELEIKAGIEVALFRKTAERELRKSAPAPSGAGGRPQDNGDGSGGADYINLPDVKTILLKDIFSDIVLYLYADPALREPIFRFAIEAGLKKGGRNFFAYHRSVLQKYFLKELQSRQLFMRRIKTGEVCLLPEILDTCMTSLPQDPAAGNLRILLDFSETDEFADILAVKNLVLARKEHGAAVSGIIAVNMADIDHDRIRQLSDGIGRTIISTGKETTLSFAHRAFPSEPVAAVPQATIDDVVKKSLEPVVLSLLDKPVSGYDIVHEIHSRYNVLIPQARVYAYLYDLEQKGYLAMKISGKSKLYSPTEIGKKYIRNRLDEFKFVFRHILGEGTAPLFPPDRK
ncbi:MULTISPECIES: response regulator [unclassified Methanoregula]|uniref:response regulator n=1 Tax=unclassified Methanoregula TaxID=2649730 RepID=UPI0009D441A5|nr:MULTISPECIES: response regulator [unclassified Methanoregula]OPX61765.1 MAG: two-component response regulator [Methanoregula sp. PtaB.Bin085]OPY33926.1 MAG: two-component response regulator [Methanoregula sp. PtaU1.Bin006]